MTETIDLRRELRRYQNTMVVAGMAVIAYGAWNVIKILMILGANMDQLRLLLATSETDYNELEAMSDSDLFLGCLIAVVMGALIFLVYFYIGRNARREGMGLRHKAYFALAVLMVIPQAFIAIYSVVDFFAIHDFDVDILITLLVDLSALYAVVEMDVAVFRVRRLDKMLKEQEG